MRQGDKERGVNLCNKYPDDFEQDKLERSSNELVSMHEDYLQEVAISIMYVIFYSFHGKHRSKMQNTDQKISNCWQLSNLFADNIIVVSAIVSTDPHLSHLAV